MKSVKNLSDPSGWSRGTMWFAFLTVTSLKFAARTMYARSSPELSWYNSRGAFWYSYRITGSKFNKICLGFSRSCIQSGAATCRKGFDICFL